MNIMEVSTAIDTETSFESEMVLTTGAKATEFFAVMKFPPDKRGLEGRVDLPTAGVYTHYACMRAAHDLSADVAVMTVSQNKQPEANRFLAVAVLAALLREPINKLIPNDAAITSRVMLFKGDAAKAIAVILGCRIEAGAGASEASGKLEGEESGHYHCVYDNRHGRTTLVVVASPKEQSQENQMVAFLVSYGVRLLTTLGDVGRQAAKN